MTSSSNSPTSPPVARAKTWSGFPNGELGIVWLDDHESYYKARDLRMHCGCAHCVDEMTGQRTLRPESVPSQITLKEIHPVGNYGLAIKFSDGHDTGIFTFSSLRERCSCATCLSAEKA